MARMTAPNSAINQLFSNFRASSHKASLDTCQLERMLVAHDNAFHLPQKLPSIYSSYG